MRIQELDLIAENRLLSFEEWDERIYLDDEMDKIFRLEDIYWRQRAGKNWVLKGDDNTRFFHQFANGRRRKNTIAFLESEHGEIRGQKDITDHIVSYYKTLFGVSERCLMTLKPNFWPQELILSDIDKE